MSIKKKGRARYNRARLEAVTAVLLLAAAVITAVVALLQLSHSW